MAAHATQRARSAILLTLLLAAAFIFTTPAATLAMHQQRFESSPVAPSGTGILGPNRYQSPQFGYDIAWEAPWEADPASTESNPAIALDRLSLTAGTGRFQVFFVAAEGETPAEYAERFIDFRASYDPTTEIVATGERRGLTWIAYTFESDGLTVSGVAEISLSEDGNTLQMVEVMDYEGTFGEAFQQAADIIVVAGGEPFRVLAGWPG